MYSLEEYVCSIHNSNTTMGENIRTLHTNITYYMMTGLMI